MDRGRVQGMSRATVRIWNAVRALRKRIPVAVLASVVALSVTACGGVSREDFASEANEICVSFSTWSAGRQEPFRSALESGDGGAAAAVLVEYERRYERALDQIDALEAPDDDADRKAIDRFLTIGRQQAALLPDLAAAVESGDVAELEDLSGEGRELEEKLGRAARDYDLDECVGTAT